MLIVSAIFILLSEKRGLFNQPFVLGKNNDESQKDTAQNHADVRKVEYREIVSEYIEVKKIYYAASCKAVNHVSHGTCQKCTEAEGQRKGSAF